MAIPIRKQLYKSIINGVLLTKININPNMFVEKSKFYYLVSIIIKEEYRKQNYKKKLLENLFNNIKSKICCITVTKEGASIINKYMNLKEKINDKVSVYEIKIN